MDHTALDAAYQAAVRFLDQLPDRKVGAAAGSAAMRSALSGPLPNEVVLNQVLVRFEPPGASPEEGDRWTREVIDRVQRDGTCWLSGTVWRGRALMRISVCNWSTTAEDVRRSAESILAAHRG